MNNTTILTRALRYGTILTIIVLVVGGLIGYLVGGVAGLSSVLLGAGVTAVFMGLTGASFRRRIPGREAARGHRRLLRHHPRHVHHQVRYFPHPRDFAPARRMAQSNRFRAHHHRRGTWDADRRHPRGRSRPSSIHRRGSSWRERRSSRQIAGQILIGLGHLIFVNAARCAPIQE